MSNVTREELLARQELDSGNPDDTVYVRPSEGNGSTTQTHARVYHDDADCYNLAANPEESTRAAEQQRWRGPCKTCTVADPTDN